jgi:uncharacterized protein (TIGR00725 family)
MKTIIGVMGGSVANEATIEAARELGRLIAEEGWVLLNGGRDAGVMRASAQGAKEAGGLVVGVLPDEGSGLVAPGIDIPIYTGMGDARNVVNVLSSRVVIALHGGAGTVSEIAHALKLGRSVVTIDFDTCDLFNTYKESGSLANVEKPAEAVAIARRLLAGGRT